MRLSAFCIHTPPPPSCPVSVEAVAYPRRRPVARALLSMFPFQPPLPTTSNLPFQLDAGIHTSILMSESFVGFTVTATRQNAGRSADALPPPRPPPFAGVKAPAATACADVIVVSASFSEARLSHVAADTGMALKIRRSINTADDNMTFFIRTPQVFLVSFGEKI